MILKDNGFRGFSFKIMSGSIQNIFFNVIKRDKLRINGFTRLHNKELYSDDERKDKSFEVEKIVVYCFYRLL